ncbi:hypothetical protein AAVH_29243 [Aphelenchoides avenae]|nr:hypothetical protein AAVH_29243 [Aphelenchus avenae]
MPEATRNPREMELNALWSHLELDGRPQMWQIKSLLANIVSVDKNVQEIEKNEIAIGTSFTGRSEGLLPFEDGGAGSSLSSSTLRTEDGRSPKLYIRTSATGQPNAQKSLEVQVKCDELLPHEYMLFKAKVTVRVPGHTTHVEYFYEVLVNNMWNDGKYKHTDGGAGSSLSSSTLRTEDGRSPKLYIRTSATGQPNAQKSLEVQVKCDELLPHEYMLFKAKVTVRVPGHTTHVEYFYEVLVNNMWNDGKYKHTLVQVENTKLKDTKLDVVIEPLTVDYWRVHHQLQLAEAWLSALTKERELTRAKPDLASLISGIRESVYPDFGEAICDSEQDASGKTKQASSAASTVDSFERVSDAINDLNVKQDR